MMNHPEVLEELDEYRDAPDGTIVAQPGCYPWFKEYGLWVSRQGWESSESLALIFISKRTVLRWGAGHEA